MSQAKIDLIDDFGNEIGIYEIACKIGHFDKYCRWLIDGMIEGIASGILKGDAPDDCLAHFGLI
jgi:hypothetical protein